MARINAQAGSESWCSRPSRRCELSVSIRRPSPNGVAIMLLAWFTAIAWTAWPALTILCLAGRLY